MARAHLYRKAADDQGNVVLGTTVTIYEPGTLATLQATLYANEIGSATIANPFVTNDGVIDFYLDQPGQVKIGLRSPAGIERFYDNEDVYPDPQTVVQAPDGLQITNIPQAGDFLQATAPGQATWVSSPELQSAALTPIQTLRQQNFSSQTLGGLSLRLVSGPTATPAFVDVNSDPKPAGFSFTHALDWDTGQTMVLSAPAELFVEAGHALFLYKILEPAAGLTAAVLRVTLDDGQLWVQTPLDVDEFGIWTIGYLTNIPPGPHLVHFHHLPGSDPDSRVLLGALVLQYGGTVPAHAHEGAGLLSTAVGKQASANFTGATALGGLAVVTGDSGTAVGAQSTAASRGTTVGATSTAAQDGVAIGYQARTSPSAEAAIAIGLNASAQASGAVAAGPHAIISDPDGVALGRGARAAQDAVAAGRQASATATGAIAIGAGATAFYSHSVALGPGAITTTPNQIMLGTATDTTVIPGDFRQSGDAALGDADSTLAFFGESGSTRPAVTGSRGGNAVLADLISYLADLGLIVDNTTP